MLKRIKIQGFKSLADFEFRPEPLSVIIGPNASGKSNLMDALYLLSRMAGTGSVRTVFEPPYRGNVAQSFTFGGAGIADILSKERVALSLSADVQLASEAFARTGPERALAIAGIRQPTEPVKLRYEVVLEFRPGAGLLRVTSESVVRLTSAWKTDPGQTPALASDGTVARTERGTAESALPGELGLQLGGSLIAPMEPDLAALSGELSSWAFFYLEPRDRMRGSSPLKQVPRIGPMGEDIIAFLYSLLVNDPSQFRALEAALHAVVPEVTGLQVNLDNKGNLDLWLVEGITPIPVGLVSDGTLRVLGLLSLGCLKDPPALIGFEEPENGLHPRRIQLLAEFLKTRELLGDSQVIVTTHSPILPDYLPEKSLFACIRRDGKTVVEPITKLLRRKRGAKPGSDEPRMSERILRGDFGS